MNKKREIGKDAGRHNSRSVSRDEVHEVPGKFPVPDRKEISGLFQMLHDKSEALYNGDGSWGRGCMDSGVFDNVKTECSKPLLRKSYQRLVAYLNMAEEDDTGVYLARAKEAAEFLRANQRADGYFPYYLDDSGWPYYIDPYGIMYVTGFSASALCHAYRFFNETSCLNAVFKACVWGARFPGVSNYNYNSIVIGMLVRGRELLKEPDNFAKLTLPGYKLAGPAGEAENCPLHEHFLNLAINKTIHDVIPGQQPNGGYLGHNSWIWYHGIITEANALVLSAIPADLPAHREIKKALIANINYIAANQLENGSLYANYEVDRVAEGNVLHVIRALIQSRKIVGNKTDNLLMGVASSFLEQIRANPGRTYNQEKKVGVEYLEGHMESLSWLHVISSAQWPGR